MFNPDDDFGFDLGQGLDGLSTSDFFTDIASLHDAVAAGNVDEMKRLLHQGALVGATAEGKARTVYLAAQRTPPCCQ